MVDKVGRQLNGLVWITEWKIILKSLDHEIGHAFSESWIPFYRFWVKNEPSTKKKSQNARTWNIPVCSVSTKNLTRFIFFCQAWLLVSYLSAKKQWNGKQCDTGFLLLGSRVWLWVFLSDRFGQNYLKFSHGFEFMVWDFMVGSWFWVFWCRNFGVFLMVHTIFEGCVVVNSTVGSAVWRQDVVGFKTQSKQFLCNLVCVTRRVF